MKNKKESIKQSDSCSPIKIHNKHFMKFPRYRRFRNPPGGKKRKFSLYKRLFFFLRRLFDTAPNFPETFITPTDEALKAYFSNSSSSTITWLGHSTFLIKLNGITILTDPFLTNFASPFIGLGPKRYSPPGIAITDLPPIDIILISHDHYDHCDLRTLKHLSNKENIQVIVPLKLGNLIKKSGFKKNQIHELDWHESFCYKGLTIYALPAYHYAKRSLFTHNTSLWSSFAIFSEKRKIFFSGDTGYGTLFYELGKAYGPFDYALISIGAYDPPDFMQTGHLSPEQAVKVGEDLEAKVLVAMHWGTIILSDECPLEPPLRFYHAAQEANYLYHSIWILNIGETRTI